jgi:hypothetical protein
MSGLWSLSQQQIRDNSDHQAPGAKAYFYNATTLTPITVYQDFGLGVPHINPVTADGIGRFPAVYLDDSVNLFFRHRVTTAGGVVIIDLSTIPIIGPVGGGGGGGTPVDPTALLQTGDPIWRLRAGVMTGFVRANAQTIGSGTSGATERAAADAQALFEYLWNNLSNTFCPVSGGRGASSFADWAANKTIGLPDMRGRAPFGLDLMGSPGFAGRITAGSITTGDPNTSGSSGGAETVTIADANLPATTRAVTGSVSGTSGIQSADHTHQVDPPNTTTGTENANHTHNLGISQFANGDPGTLQVMVAGGTFATNIENTSHAHDVNIAPFASGIQSASHTHSFAASLASGVTAALGSGTPTNKMPPFMLGIWYMKLALPLLVAAHLLAPFCGGA